MKDIQVKNKMGYYRAIQLSRGKWLDFASGEIKKIPAGTKYANEYFELVVSKPAKKVAKKKKTKSDEDKKEAEEVEEKD